MRWLAICLLLACWPAAADLTVASHGQTDYELVVLPTALRAPRLAAEELQTFLERATGVRLPVVAAPTPGKHQIHLGASPAARQAGVSVELLPPESFRLKTVGEDIFLVGRDTAGDPAQFTRNYPCEAGTLTAAYEFLERFVGVRFCWDDDLGTVVPRQTAVTVPPTDLTQSPTWRSRELGYGPRNATYGLYGRRLRLGWSDPRVFGHNWFRTLPCQQYGREHPEYFALVQGRRSTEYYLEDHGGQVCTSNPEVVRRFAQAAIDYFNQPHGIGMYSLCPNDGGGFCECPNCRALDGGETSPDGSPVLTDRLLTFYNAIAEQVAKVHPNKRLGAYIYSFYTRPPRRVTRIHPLIELQFATNTAYQQGVGWPAEVAMARRWIELAPRFDKYDIYYLGTPLLHLPAPLMTHLIERLQTETALGYQGGYLYIGNSYEQLGAGHYVAARLMWDRTADPRALETDYYRALYGPAAADVKAWYDLLEHRLRQSLTTGLTADEPGLAAFSGRVEGGFTHAQVLGAYWPVLDQAAQILTRAAARPLSELEAQRLARLRDHQDLLESTVRGLVAAGRLQSQSTANADDAELLQGAVKQREAAKVRLAAYAPTLLQSLTAGDQAETALVSPAGALFQQGASQRPPALAVAWAPQAPEVDGRGDDSAWQAAPMHHLALCRTASPGTCGSRARLLRDAAHLYVLVEGREPGDQLRQQVAAADDLRIFDDDAVEVMLQPAGGERYYHLAVNAAGALWDATYPTGDPGRFEVAWQSSARVGVAVTPTGWSAELAIPWRAFGVDGPAAGWRGNVYRTRRGLADPDEYTAVAPTFGGYHERRRFAALQLLDAAPGAMPYGSFDELPADWQRRLQVGGQGDFQFHADSAGAWCGSQALRIQVSPGGLAYCVLAAPVKPNASYRIVLLHRNQVANLNPQHRDQAPVTRVIFRDDAGQAVTPTTGYSWHGAAAQAQPGAWRQLAHVFRTPPGTTQVGFTVFFFHPGEYWLDEVRLEAL